MTDAAVVSFLPPVFFFLFLSGATMYLLSAEYGDALRSCFIYHLGILLSLAEK